MGPSLKQIKQLSKFLTYVLGHQPDEFGLIPDSQGFVGTKNLLRALHEDSEWSHIRHSHLNELIISLTPTIIEMTDDRIRAIDRTQLPQLKPAPELPKLLYTCVRKRAYSFVSANGVRPLGGLPYVVLSSETTMAYRLGRRFDNHPILLTVQTKSGHGSSAAFKKYGQHLFLIDYLSPTLFTGPPISNDSSKPDKPKPTPEKTPPVTPGSYFPDPGLGYDRISDPVTSRRRKESDWKKNRRQARKEKQHRQG